MKGTQLIGCSAAVFHLLFSLPAWFVLMGWLLLKTEAPTWIWVIYALYVPFTFLAAGFVTWPKIAEQFEDKESKGKPSHENQKENQDA